MAVVIIIFTKHGKVKIPFNKMKPETPIQYNIITLLHSWKTFPTNFQLQTVWQQVEISNFAFEL